MTAPGIALAATFTSDGVVDSLDAALRGAGTDRAVRAAPYGQILEPLHDPDGVLLANTGVNMLLIRVEDLRSGPAETARDDRALTELLSVLRSAPTRCAATWLVAVTPPSPAALADPATSGWVRDAAQRIGDAVDEVPGMHLVPVNDIPERYEVPAVHDEYADRLAHLPYTDDYFAAIADVLARLAATTWRKPRKVVVLDCDNTLWAGVCGEDGPLGVRIDEPYRAVQEFMLDQREQGKLLCLCSRNNEHDVEAVFTGNPRMRLAMRDVTAHRIGWGPKPESLRELSEELGLALNSFIFVDDDPVECAAVRAQLPEVAVVELTRDAPEVRRQLLRERAFDQLAITEEDRLRADWYAAEPDRAALRRSADDYQEFLDRCAIEVDLHELRDAALERAAQLTARTTQFTLTGTVRTVPQLRQALVEGDRGWTVRVRDAFGDYGTVGLVLARAAGEVLDVPVFLLSCRVLNRRVEHRVLDVLATEARAAGCGTVRLHYRATDRNAPARLFLEQLGGAPIEADAHPGSVEVSASDTAGRPTASSAP